MTAVLAPQQDLPGADRAVQIPQYSRRAIVAIWAAAAVPMGLLSWVVAPLAARELDGPAALQRSLLVCLLAGLVWQFVLVLGLVRREQGNVRWSTLKGALWLSKPTSPRTGRRGGRVWWIVLPLIIGFGAEELIPGIAMPASRDFSSFIQSSAGKALFHGSWLWFGIELALVLFNTVLGEELLFRGFLLPRMNGAFGKKDWLVNGVMFAGYHVHMPWVMPAALLDSFFLSWSSKRYRSALIGIAVHSAQSVVILIGVLVLVLNG